HITNFGRQTVSVRLGLEVRADFADIFEVRGQRRPRRGHYLDPVVRPDGIDLPYTGLDGVSRTTQITTNPEPTIVNETELCFDITIGPQDVQVIDLAIACEAGDGVVRRDHDEAMYAANASLADERAGCIDIHTSNEQFNDWLNQSLEDLHMLTTNLTSGPYPYAGIPWFSTAFGRDGIITALQTLWAYPALARGVLAFLAATQATEEDPASDAEPGKILHETRKGEMAALGEIPFSMYYGSVDSTPLFIVLAGRYYEATADRAFIQSIWPNIEAALGWLDHYGDLDGDGFIEYKRKEDSGLLNQGWKDSHDSVFHADGRMAQPPIAICEMQGYAYAAHLAAAQLAEVVGRPERADELRSKAETLRALFEEHFWDEDLGTYVLALDGDKQPCRVASSNAGHALFAGIASPERAERVARALLSGDSFSGWGIRTVSTVASRFNPMSYHNGSIWPHDNSLIADGLARYGHQDMAAEVLTALFDASIFLDQHRLPELFCGFPKRPGEGPTLYPVACAPQAWAAGSVFMLLGACLGMTFDAPQQRLRFNRPLLPEYLDRVRAKNLRVG
ncbi:MAG TPA: glycogen debranching N-terminal domain-containing protein, partial [Thermomicrobiales bacterium]|nr:glycogen debranching N-terminal domain-containing protein [Thermomicrobiales bacterium]